MRLGRKAVAAFVILLGICAVPVMAVTLRQNLTNVFVPGADQAGNPSYANGGSGSGKIYKDTFTRIVTVQAQASVENDYGFAVQFHDLGWVIYDPWAQAFVTSDSDVTTLSRPRRGVSQGSLQAVAVP